MPSVAVSVPAPTATVTVLSVAYRVLPFTTAVTVTAGAVCTFSATVSGLTVSVIPVGAASLSSMVAATSVALPSVTRSGRSSAPRVNASVSSGSSRASSTIPNDAAALDEPALMVSVFAVASLRSAATALPAPAVNFGVTFTARSSGSVRSSPSPFFSVTVSANAARRPSATRARAMASASTPESSSVMVTVGAVPPANVPSLGLVTAMAAVNCSSPSITRSAVIGISTLALLLAPAMTKVTAAAA